MEQIRNYVEALFSALPKTGELLRIKQEMLANLEEKYAALLAEGKNENEAMGAVIASIGSADELRAELGFSEDPAVNPVAEPVSAPAHDPALLAEYRSYLDHQHLFIAIAVALFILSPIMYQVFEGLGDNIFGQVAMFGAIAAGVVLIIFGSRRDDYYEDVLGLGRKEHGDAAPTSGKRNRLTALFASLAFPIATVVYLCLGFSADLWHPGWIIFVICGVLTGAIAAIEEYRRGE